MDIYASDEEKAEAIKQWWRENGRSVIAGIVLGGAAIFGFRYWMNYQQVQTEQASVMYQQATIQLSQSEREQAQKTVDQLMQDYGSTAYAVFAALEMAEKATAEGDNDTAVSHLNWVVDNASMASHQELARLRLAQLHVSAGELEQASALVDQAALSAYQSLFAELRGDIKLAQGDTAAAHSAYQQAMLTLAAGEPRQSLLQMKLDQVAVADEG
jgi:predicted negative regulator of RcsB-dependent stress response